MTELATTQTTRMTNTEAVMLCRFAKACCPQQQIDEYTPDAWWELLNDLDFAACKVALTEVVKHQPFVAPSEIREQIKRTRSDRMQRHRHLIYDNWPGHFESDEAQSIWHKQVGHMIAEGHVQSAEDIPAWTEDEVLAFAEPRALREAPQTLDSLADNVAAARAAIRANAPRAHAEREAAAVRQAAREGEKEDA